ncbi:MbcA/ParS/Xre antitoxin family protein [Temperatibacter marinus]|uniref:MbcA/ParS/Xre antitoxin family protein n=1 Tax=Temperatibacter marinus TaxID=1456591 RepID=A0AA52EE13_9PROT|nr:MbcA/ParS/Xre antitoxin family protein [Temperatibacter marinus]WND03061.1 MbcA/ParS/Xre antitoxin family protein [Temperatibacter marinus]
MQRLSGEERLRKIREEKAQNKQLAPFALLAFFKLAEEWNLSVSEQMTILGHPSRSTFYNWKAEKIAGVPHDTLSRLSHIMAIHRALGMLFPDAEKSKEWVMSANAQLGGQTPLDRLLAGDLADIAIIRGYLDGMVQSA